jgi:pyrroline-5-carboxylate reductase
MEKIGFIGYGNIGNLIVNNILSLNLIKQGDIIVSNRNLNKLNSLKKNYPNLTITSNNEFLAKKSQVIFIFVETPDFKNVLMEIKPHLNKKSYLIHCSAGLSFDMISKVYSGKISQIIPTIISKSDMKLEKSEDSKKLSQLENIKKGITLISHNVNVEKEDKKFIEDLFKNFTNIKILSEKELENERNLETSTLLSSSGPALISCFIKKVAIILNQYSSLKSNDLEDILIKTLKSTAIQLDEENLTINELIDKTATKGGITQVGLDYIEENGDQLDKLFKELFEKYDDVKFKLNQEYSK